MGSGKRERKETTTTKNINPKKIAVVITVLIVIIAVVIIIINKDKIFVGSEKEEVVQAEVAEEMKTQTIEEILADFGGEIIDTPKSDTYYVSKDDIIYTIYTDGTIIEGQVEIWNGESSEPAVDEAGNYNIYSAEELKWIADRVINGEKNFNDVTITLRTDIDLGARKNDNGEWEGPTWTAVIGFLDEIENSEDEETNTVEANTTEENTNTTEENVETGDEENLKRFAGCFDGNGYSIRGMYVNSENKYQGLFGYLSGTAQNLTIKASYVSGGDGSGIIAGLNSGTITNCNIENCIVEGKSEKAGGVVGINMTSANITNTNVLYGGVASTNYVGGIAGYVNNNSNITVCTSETTVTGEDYVGGICGITFYGSVIEQTINNGQVTGKNFVGGIAGYSQAQLDDVQNTGKISGTEHIGGICGTNYTMGTITKSINFESVSGERNIGGISGTNNATISNCYNKGSVECTDYRAGGIVGQNSSDSFILTSYNIGNISGNESIGGICGGNFGEITVCYYLEDCVKTDENNGGTSKTEEEMKSSIIKDLGDSFVEDTENVNDGYPILNYSEEVETDENVEEISEEVTEDEI